MYCRCVEVDEFGVIDQHKKHGHTQGNVHKLFLAGVWAVYARSTERPYQMN